MDQVSKDLEGSLKIHTGYCDVKTATGSYSCIRGWLGFKHEPRFKVGYTFEATKQTNVPMKGFVQKLTTNRRMVAKGDWHGSYDHF